VNLDALLHDTGAPSATEPQATTAAATPLIRGLERGLEETTPPPPRKDENPFARYRDDPLGFAREVLGLTLWDAMEQILLAVRDHRKVAVRSGHKVSKSTTSAVIALWRCLCREGSRTVLSAPTARQVKAIIWKELTQRHRAARLPGDLFVDPGTGFRYRDSEVFGFSTDDAEKMAGISGADLLFIIDEASGVQEAIFEAIEGNMAGGASILLISNPTQTSGTFYDAFTTKRHLWITIHISSEHTPNVLSGETLIPGLATRAWVLEKKAEWGEDSPLFQVRVRGNFPDQAENAVIGLGLVEAARSRADAETDPPRGAFALGVDVARYGDDSTVLQPLFGLRPTSAVTYRKQDNVEVAGHVMDLVQQLRSSHDYPVVAGPVRVKVDDLGNGGGVTDTLKHSRRAALLGIEVCPVIVSSRATAPGYSLLRDQLWFALRDWLKGGGQLPADSQLEGELVAPLYTFDTQGRSKVESKDDLKKRLGRSPDRADALALAVYNPPMDPSEPTAGAVAAAFRGAARRRSA
jgi:phage terminase large subunit